MTKHLFDMIDWGKDKDLERCYRFSVTDFLADEFTHDRVLDFNESITTGIDHFSSYFYNGDYLGVPYNQFWVEFHDSTGGHYHKKAAYCQYEINSGLEEDPFTEMTCFFFSLYTGVGASTEPELILSHVTASVVFDLHHLVDYWGAIRSVDTVSARLSFLPTGVVGRSTMCLGEYPSKRHARNPYSDAHPNAITAGEEIFHETFGCVMEFLRLRTERDMIYYVPNRQQQRKAARKGNPPLNEYYELTKYAKGEHPSRYADSNKSQGLNRHHSVMGNWAYYSPDAPMLGHTSGWVWRPAHMRGNQKRGKIDKDYNVSA